MSTMSNPKGVKKAYRLTDKPMRSTKPTASAALHKQQQLGACAASTKQDIDREMADEASDSEATIDNDDTTPAIESPPKKTSKNVLPKLAFKRLVQEISLDMGAALRFEDAALEALQEASEVMLVQYFACTYAAAVSAGRETITVKDMRYMNRMYKLMKGIQLGKCE